MGAVAIVIREISHTRLVTRRLLPQGCKWGLRRLRQFLTASHGAVAVERLFQRIAHVVMTSLRAVQQAILQDRWVP